MTRAITTSQTTVPLTAIAANAIMAVLLVCGCECAPHARAALDEYRPARELAAWPPDAQLSNLCVQQRTDPTTGATLCDWWVSIYE